MNGPDTPSSSIRNCVGGRGRTWQNSRREKCRLSVHRWLWRRRQAQPQGQCLHLILEIIKKVIAEPTRTNKSIQFNSDAFLKLTLVLFAFCHESTSCLFILPPLMYSHVHQEFVVSRRSLLFLLRHKWSVR